MAVIEGDFVSCPISNATMKELLRDGELDGYRIYPDNGYVLHDKDADMYLENVEIYNEETGEFEIVTKTILGFKSGSASCLATYDFVSNPREFYTILREDAPADAVIFGGGGNNNHEI